PVPRAAASGPPVTNLRVSAPAREFQPGPVKLRTPLAPPGPPDQDRGGVGHQLKPGFTFPALKLGPPPLGPLDEQPEDQQRLHNTNCDDPDNLPLVLVPEALLLALDGTAGGKGLLADPPTLNLRPSVH